MQLRLQVRDILKRDLLVQQVRGRRAVDGRRQRRNLHVDDDARALEDRPNRRGTSVIVATLWQ